MDVKKLGVVVEQKGIAPTAKNLESLAKASDKAAPAVERLSSSLKGFKSVNLDSFAAKLQDTSLAIKEVKASTSGMADMAKNIAGLSINLTNIANSTDRLSGKTKALDEFTNSVRALKTELNAMKGLSGSLSGVKVASGGGSIGGTRSSNTDPETKAQQRLMQQLERTSMMAGRTKSEYLALRAAQVGVSDAAAPFIARIKEVEGRTLGATMSTKQYNAALRMVPAQFTDIATQLAGGQNPLLILMQQGGQLKDMFGGVGGALRAVGSELMKVLGNPLVLLAAAVAAVGYAVYSTTKELDNFNKASITSNGIIGLSTQGFTKMRDSIASISGSKSLAAEALTEIAKQGSITAENVKEIGVASVKMSQVTGTSIKDAVAMYAELQQTPLETITKLDKAYNLLTNSTKNQIKSLVEQGKTTEAVALAQQTLTDAISRMAAESEVKLSGIEWLFKKIKSAANTAIEAIRDVGSTSDAEKLKSINEDIVRLKNRQTNGVSFRPGLDAKELANLETQRDIMLDTMRGQAKAAENRANSVAKENAMKSATEKFDKLTEGSLKLQVEKQKEKDQVQAAYNAKVKLGIKDKDDELILAQSLAAIDKKYKETPDRSSEKAQKRVDTYEKEISSIQGLIEAEKAKQQALQTSDETIEKQAAHLATLAKWQDVASKTNVSSAERTHANSLVTVLKQLVAEEEYTITLKASNKEKEKAKKVNDDIASMAQRNTDLVENAAAAYELESMHINMTTKERAAALAVYNVEVEKKKAVLEIDKKIADNSNNASAKKQYEDIREQTVLAYNEKAKYAAMQNQLNEQEMSWYDNLTMAAKQYTETLGTQNQQVQSSFIGIFGTIEGALTDFVSNTKTSFKDLATYVLKQLAVMFAKMALTKAAMAGMGLLTSALTPSNANTTIPMQAGGGYAKGGAFTSTGVAKFAKGGAFTNSVVNKPTPIAFAKGAGFAAGVIGEKTGSPGEAVMPLSRMSGGDLGIKTSGSGSVQNNVSVNITMQQDGTATTSTQSDNANSKAFGELMARKAKEVIAQEQRPGGLLSTR